MRDQYDVHREMISGSIYLKFLFIRTYVSRLLYVNTVTITSVTTHSSSLRVLISCTSYCSAFHTDSSTCRPHKPKLMCFEYLELSFFFSFCSTIWIFQRRPCPYELKSKVAPSPKTAKSKTSTSPLRIAMAEHRNRDEHSPSTQGM